MSESAQDTPSADETNDLLRLRELLLGAEYEDLLELKSCLNNPEAFSQKISSVISESITQRLKKDQSLPEALAPTIGAAIQESISNDPQALADSLYPIMGPAIRKSIAETMAQMLENMNQLLEQSLSPKSIGWRFDAWRSGRSYAEVVLTNTLEYQVEQVFLIHAETSLLIQHVVAELAITKDPDLVSSMLSAIQDYIHDSFAVDASQTLKSMSLGDLTVVIEKGPGVILAAVIRGRIPRELDNIFKETLEGIHQRCGQRLLTFSGDTNDFSELEPALRGCLLYRRQDKEVEKKRKIPWLAIIFILALGSVVAYFSYKSFELDEQRELALTNLNREAGIVIINSSTNTDGELVINGLRDPLSLEPEEVARQGLPETLKLSFIFRPYLSIEAEIVEARAVNILQAPTGVLIILENETLIVSGNAEVSWAEELEHRWTSIHGVEALDKSNLSTYDPVLIEIATLQEFIEGFSIYFDNGEIESLDFDLENLASNILRINNLAQSKGEQITIHLYGATDGSGTNTVNLRIAQDRAENIYNELLSLELPEEIFETHTLQGGLNSENETEERRVFFRITGLPAA